MHDLRCDFLCLQDTQSKWTRPSLYDWRRWTLARRRQRLASETAEEREARLSKDRARRRQRLASETAEERVARLSIDRAHRRQRLASESAEQRAARLTEQHKSLPIA